MCEYYRVYPKHVLNIPSIPIKLQVSPFFHNTTNVVQLAIATYDNWVRKEDMLMQRMGSRKLSDVYTREEYIAENMLLGCGGDGDEDDKNEDDNVNDGRYERK